MAENGYGDVELKAVPMLFASFEKDCHPKYFLEVYIYKAQNVKNMFPDADMIPIVIQMQRNTGECSGEWDTFFIHSDTSDCLYHELTEYSEDCSGETKAIDTDLSRLLEHKDDFKRLFETNEDKDINWLYALKGIVCPSGD